MPIDLPQNILQYNGRSHPWWETPNPSFLLHVTHAVIVGDFSFCFFYLIWESPSSIWLMVTKKPRFTGRCQRFEGKGLVVARKDISTLNIPYLR